MEMVLLRLWIVNRKRYVVKTEENLCHNLCDDRREHKQYADEIVERKATYLSCENETTKGENLSPRTRLTNKFILTAGHIICYKNQRYRFQ